MITLIIYKNEFVKDVEKYDNGLTSTTDSEIKEYVEKKYGKECTYKILDKHEAVRNIMGW